MGAVRALFAELDAYVSGDARIWFGLLAATLLQIGYWYLATPGPQILGLQRANPFGALLSVVWALLFLGLLPQLIAMILRMSSPEAGVRLGDWRFGVPATLAACVIVLPLLYVGAQDPALQAHYPWPGAWLGLSVTNIVLWASVYGLYYLAFEFFYRGFLLRLIEPVWGLMPAVWLQATLYILIHVGKPLPETLSSIPMALVFTALAVRGRSILYPFVLHFVIGMANDLFSLHHQGLLLP